MQNQIEELFHLYYRPLCVYAIGLLNDVNFAEDVVMDCFVKLWKRQNANVEIKDVKSYLYLMVRNACYDYNKTAQIDKVDLDNLNCETELNENEKFSEIAVSKTKANR